MIEVFGAYLFYFYFDKAQFELICRKFEQPHQQGGLEELVWSNKQCFIFITKWFFRELDSSVMEIVPDKIRMEGETVLTQVAYLIWPLLFFRKLIFILFL